MSDWQERITRETPPAIQAEHELRYQLVTPLLADSSVWVDLGCGSGLGAACAFGDARPDRAVLVDLDHDIVSIAARELGMPDAIQLAGDLTDPALLARIEQALLEVAGARVVTCFEVVEHLTTFLPLVEWASALARDHAATFVISVPNDAFWSIDNPFHMSKWGEGAFEELCGLLPSERTVLRQVALTGSAIVDWAATREQHQLDVDVGGASAVTTHFLAAFGPRHHKLRPAAVAVQTDLLSQRRWERQRDSNLAHAEAQVAEQRETIRAQLAEFEEWRAYIHELERALGRPLAGSDEAPRPHRKSANDPSSAGRASARGRRRR